MRQKNGWKHICAKGKPDSELAETRYKSLDTYQCPAVEWMYL
jgi:hypothetical protein